MVVISVVYVSWHAHYLGRDKAGVLQRPVVSCKPEHILPYECYKKRKVRFRDSH